MLHHRLGEPEQAVTLRGAAPIPDLVCIDVLLFLYYGAGIADQKHGSEGQIDMAAIIASPDPIIAVNQVSHGSIRDFLGSPEIRQARK